MSDLDSFAFEPGQQVQCKTRYDDVFTGEVVAFDLASKILILKSPTTSSGNPNTASSTNHDLHCLVLDSVSEVDILEEPQPGKCTNDLPSLGVRYVNAKIATALNERYRLVQAVSNGVSKEGISLYTEFLKKYDRAEDVTWKEKVKIVVMNTVVVSPPYKETNCEPLSKKTRDEGDLRAVNYVKNIVKKFWENHPTKQKQQVATEPVVSSTISSTTKAST